MPALKNKKISRLRYASLGMTPEQLQSFLKNRMYSKQIFSKQIKFYIDNLKCRKIITKYVDFIEQPKIPIMWGALYELPALC